MNVLPEFKLRAHVFDSSGVQMHHENYLLSEEKRAEETKQEGEGLIL